MRYQTGDSLAQLTLLKEDQYNHCLIKTHFRSFIAAASLKRNMNLNDHLQHSEFAQLHRCGLIEAGACFCAHATASDYFRSFIAAASLKRRDVLQAFS